MRCMLAIFLETLNITAPVFAMLFLGVFLRRIGAINDGFIVAASGLVFNVTMPALLFLGIIHADLRTALQPKLLIFFQRCDAPEFRVRLGMGDLALPVRRARDLRPGRVSWQ
ncbi:hypothetical protein IBA8401_30320 [Pseudomonas syringae]